MLKSFAKQTYRGKPVRTKRESGLQKLLLKVVVVCVLGGLSFVILKEFSWIKKPSSVSFQGKTMGESFTVTCYGISQVKKAELEKVVLRQVEATERLVSGSLYQSELSKFNAFSLSSPKIVSPEFFKLLTFCEQLYHKTGGAWDGAGRLPAIVSQDMQVKQRGGFYKIVLIQPYFVQKTDPSITLNLSGIAYGYLLDQISSTLQKNGVKTYKIQLGDRTLVAGHPSTPWSVEKNQLIVKLDNQSINFSSGLIVIAESSTLADGLLAAIKSLPIQEAAKISESYPKTNIIFLVK